MTTQLYEVLKDGNALWDAVILHAEQHLKVVDLSFDHEFGTHREWGAEYDDFGPLRFVVLNPEHIPESFHKTFRLGGCDGEHRGRCGKACAEVEAELFFSITEEAHDLGALVTVEIERS